MEQRQPLAGFMERPSTSNARWFMGSLLNFLATGRQTGGQFSVFEAKVRRGEEVPPHTHSREDETFYVLEGEMACTVGDNTYHAKVGDLVFLPRDVQHTWKALTEPTRFLVWINPAGLEKVFLACSEPAPVMELPPVAAGPDDALTARVVAMDNQYGVVYAFQTEAPQ